VQFVEVNGSPGLVFSDGDVPEMVMSAEFDTTGRILRIFSQLNPEKLGHLAP
jgi:hypothetical protein